MKLFFFLVKSGWISVIMDLKYDLIFVSNKNKTTFIYWCLCAHRKTSKMYLPKFTILQDILIIIINFKQ